MNIKNMNGLHKGLKSAKTIVLVQDVLSIFFPPDRLVVDLALSHFTSRGHSIHIVQLIDHAMLRVDRSAENSDP